MGIPVVALGDDYAGTFSLHDHGVDEILERFLGGDEFFHDYFVDFVNPMWNFSLFILFIAENRVDGFVDDFFEFFRRELNFLKFLRHEKFIFLIFFEMKISCIL